jgi:hypothetical protein
VVIQTPATTTALTSSVNSSTYGQGVTLTATVSAVSPGLPTPTGSVDFFDTTNTDLGRVTLSGGVATLNISSLAAGSHAITATYSSDGTFMTSNASLTQTVNKATLTVTANNASKVYGQANPTLTASYSGFVNGETLASSGVSGSPSLNTTATASSAPGTYTITAGPGNLAANNYAFTLVNGTLTGGLARGEDPP